AIAHYDGDPLNVRPVLKVRGRYRDFALLETPTLGALTRATRIATNVYNVLVAARGKPVLFFPARFDAHEVQAADGYAYNIAVQRYNRDYGHTLGSFISTDAQGDWWGGLGGGWIERAREWCRDVRIVVTGGFGSNKIRRFEELGVPVDIYGVGSSLFSNSDEEGTNNDFTADVVRVRLNDEWSTMAKVGRA